MRSWCYVVYFFFSSRRRHTRYWRDWSSDVCSSDLVDATGLSAAELRALSKELSGRRPAKDLRQLSAFLDEVAPGDLVGLPVEHGAGLLLGEVVGDYAFADRKSTRLNSSHANISYAVICLE